MRQPFRLQPQLPAGSMKTYQIIAPRSTHFRAATCAEAECPNHMNGWKTPIDETTELGSQQAFYIRNNSGRQFYEDRNIAPGVTVFTFPAGQQCFSQHQLRLDKPEIFVVKGGDWRGNPTGDKKQHVNADDWVEDFAEHQDKLAERMKEG